MKIIRWILGRIILLVDALTSPTPVIREPGLQREIDELTSTMAIYQFETCPFCVKVRRELRRQSLSIELRDAKNDLDIKAELVREGGAIRYHALEPTTLTALSIGSTNQTISLTTYRTSLA